VFSSFGLFFSWRCFFNPAAPTRTIFFCDGLLKNNFFGSNSSFFFVAAYKPITNFRITAITARVPLAGQPSERTPRWR
jgi:hypothetical protein